MDPRSRHRRDSLDALCAGWLLTIVLAGVGAPWLVAAIPTAIPLLAAAAFVAFAGLTGRLD